jgi:hypothetical protein
MRGKADRDRTTRRGVFVTACARNKIKEEVFNAPRKIVPPPALRKRCQRFGAHRQLPSI